MSAWKEWRDAEPVEHGGRDEWGACCWWQDTRLCRCADYVAPDPPARNLHDVPPAPRERWEVKP